MYDRFYLDTVEVADSSSAGPTTQLNSSNKIQTPPRLAHAAAAVRFAAQLRPNFGLGAGVAPMQDEQEG